MDNFYWIMIILGAVLVILAALWVRHHFKKKNKVKQVFEDIISDFEQAERMMIDSEGERDPYEILWEIRKNKASERGLNEYANQNNQTNTGRGDGRVYKKISSFASNEEGVTEQPERYPDRRTREIEGTEYNPPKRSILEQPSGRQAISPKTFPVYGATDRISPRAKDNNPNSFISRLRGRK